MGLTTILTLWSYGSKSFGNPTIENNINYAKHFDLSEEDMLKCKNSKVCVVHHDEHGKIVNIEAR